MGMNHRGEIDYLTRIAKPDVCTITNIGEAHIGNLGSKENIFKAKCEIFNGLTDGGLAVMNGDDEFLVKLREDAEKQRRFHFVFIGEAQNCDFRAVNIRDTLPEELMFTAVTPTGTYDIDVPAAGRHLIYPALTAAAIGAYYGMSNEEIAAGIAHYTATGMRMETLHLPGNRTLYNDTYNAKHAENNLDREGNGKGYEGNKKRKPPKDKKGQQLEGDGSVKEKPQPSFDMRV